MDPLIQKKEKIVNQHMQRIVEANQKILETIGSILKDKKVDAKIKLQVTKIMNLSAGGGGGSTTDMASQDKLEVVKGFLNNANTIMATLRDKSGYQGLIQNIDDQLEIYRTEIKGIDQELNTVEDTERKKELWRQRDKAISKAD